MFDDIDQLLQDMEPGDDAKELDESQELDGDENDLDEQESETTDEDESGGGDDEQTEDGESDDDDDDEGDPETDPAKDHLITWKTGDGTEYSVTKEELQKGYLRQQDYTHKTTDFAKEKTEFQAQQSKGFEQVRQYATELAQLQNSSQTVNSLEQYINTIDPDADPINYSAAVSKLQMARQQRDGLASRIGQVNQQRTFEQQQQVVDAQKQAMTELSTGANALPNFGKKLIQQMNDAGKEYGLSEQELSGITEPRYIHILHDAMKYRELQSKRPKAVKKTKSAPARQVRTERELKPKQALSQFDKAPTIENMARLMSNSK